MLVIPAIDIKNGKCVRLVQGDPERETIYSDDPVAMALEFQRMGAKLIHVVDLDGAFEGRPVNIDLVIMIQKSLTIPIEIGGGIRDLQAVRTYLNAGIKRIILGTAVLEGDPKAIVERYGRFIVAGVDAKNSMVATRGWKNLSSVAAVDLIKELKKIGIMEYIYTDISTDGMLAGPNVEAMENILTEVAGIALIASGGVSSLDDIGRLAVLAPRGLKGCIVGKAIYDGRVNAAEALAVR
ncbi:MAG: 1-(5-phosphoribosyl)-5-[(5-phosphoribosylamino)methylideneamino]imidazole-4-carboxamide isomerase [Spirochaetales bacterium]|nr:MAG: 1-(5-phosphoribosyl)-5-[(5-phosphoribosylamino)methylideneamino]imidazole-4-carboxamide isomerase [Spirochaetales bacterium]